MTITREDLYIRLTHDDERDVSFETEDESRFFLSVSETIAAGRLHVQRRDLRRESMERVRALQKRLSAWCKRHAADIHTAYLSFRGGRLAFLVIQKGVPLNESLESDLIDLDIEIAKSLEIRPIVVDVMLLPECDEDCVNTFVTKAERTPVPHANP
jgi:hypothetical protein